MEIEHDGSKFGIGEEMRAGIDGTDGARNGRWANRLGIEMDID